MSTFDSNYNLLADARRVWMIQANEPIWHWDRLLDDKPESIDWGGDKWVKGKAARHRILHEVKAGDIAFCYQAHPDKKLLAVARFSRGGYLKRGRGLVFDLDWWMRIPSVDYNIMKTDRLLAGSEKVKVGQGTLFRVSPKEAQKLLALACLSNFEANVVGRELRLPKGFISASRQASKCVDIVEPPKRVPTEILRIVRDSMMSSAAKHACGFACSICGERLVKGDGNPYAEGHHLQPLGGKHHGPDIVENIIVLCPNHHAEFDFGAIAIDPESEIITHSNTKNKWHGSKAKGDISGLGKLYLQYHFTSVFHRGG